VFSESDSDATLALIYFLSFDLLARFLARFLARSCTRSDFPLDRTVAGYSVGLLPTGLLSVGYSIGLPLDRTALVCWLLGRIAPDRTALCWLLDRTPPSTGLPSSLSLVVDRHKMAVSRHSRSILYPIVILSHPHSLFGRHFVTYAGGLWSPPAHDLLLLSRGILRGFEDGRPSITTRKHAIRDAITLFYVILCQRRVSLLVDFA